jgi:hypothetical protein
VATKETKQRKMLDCRNSLCLRRRSNSLQSNKEFLFDGWLRGFRVYKNGGYQPEKNTGNQPWEKILVTMT